MLALYVDMGCAEALTYLVGALATADVTDTTFDLLSLATLVVLLKKTEEEMAALRALGLSDEIVRFSRHAKSGNYVPT